MKFDKEFYITFGQKDADRRNGWIRLSHCSSEDIARRFAWDKFGRNWSMIYEPETFKPEYFPDGELAEYKVNQ